MKEERERKLHTSFQSLPQGMISSTPTDPMTQVVASAIYFHRILYHSIITTLNYIIENNEGVNKGWCGGGEALSWLMRYVLILCHPSGQQMSYQEQMSTK